MGRVIEVYKPSHFTPKTKWLPPEERGKLLGFPTDVNTQPQLQKEQTRITSAEQEDEAYSILMHLMWVLIRPA